LGNVGSAAGFYLPKSNPLSLHFMTAQQTVDVPAPTWNKSSSYQLSSIQGLEWLAAAAIALGIVSAAATFFWGRRKHSRRRSFDDEI
jgi:hypothetical protein